MLRTFSYSLALLLVLAAFSPVTAQYKCWKCKGEKFLPCTNKKHDPKRACGISIPHKCTAVYGIKCCRGVGKIVCARCNDAVAEVELNDEIELRKSWLERHRDHGKIAGIKYAVVETDHFVLYWSIPRWKANTISYSKEKGAHLFAERLENLADRYVKVTGVLPSTKQRLYLSRDAGEHFRATLKYMKVGQKSGFKSYSHTSSFATWPMPQIDSDDMFHAAVIHNATHMLNQSSITFVMEFSSWFDVGMGHWFEREQFGRCRNFCFNETKVKDAWEKGNWPRQIFTEVRTGRCTEMAKVLKLGLHSMDHRLHAHCWSFVDFLIKSDPEKFKEFFRSIKGSNDARKALDSVYNMSTAAFHDAWKAWVLKAYAQ